jgi:hypothetical protein
MHSASFSVLGCIWLGYAVLKVIVKSKSGSGPR